MARNLASGRTRTSTRFLRRNMNSCLSFNGSSAYVTVTDVPSVNPSSAISMTAWILPTGNNRRIFSKDNSGLSKRSYVFKIGASNDLNMIIWLNGGGLSSHTAGTVIPGRWSHVTGTYDGTSVITYINAVAQGTSAFSGTIDAKTTDLIFGRNPSGATSEYWLGSMDELALYKDVALTPNQISNIYYQGNYPSAGLVGLWRFDEGSGTVASDSSGSANTGTITAATYSTNVALYSRNLASGRLGI